MTPGIGQLQYVENFYEEMQIIPGFVDVYIAIMLVVGQREQRVLDRLVAPFFLNQQFIPFNQNTISFILKNNLNFNLGHLLNSNLSFLFDFIF